MRNTLLAGLLVVATAGIVFASPPPAEPGCCACYIPDHDSAVEAFFCTSPTSSSDYAETETRCGNIPGAALLCAATQDVTTPVTQTCAADLRQNGIICPGTPAPVVSSTALGFLAILLGAFGAWAARRRSLRRSH